MNLIKQLALLSVLTGLAFGQTGGRYLIITHDDYVRALEPLAEWKTQKGIKAKIVPLSQIGYDSTEIRAYILNAYNTWSIPPEYLLFVGNPTQVPFPRYEYLGNIGNTDNYYADMTGDFHNELIPGRFYVFDTLEVQAIVSKVLAYDKSPCSPDRSWLKKGMTIVNEDQDPLPSDSVYYADAQYMHDLMASAGFVHIDTFSEYAGHDETDVIAGINQGRAYIMYRGVAWSRWDYPFWDIYPDQMHNGEKTPIVISSTCQTVDGIGYEWLNAGTPDEPKGTVGFFGTTTGLFNAAALRSALARGTLQSIFCDSLSTLGKAAEQGRLNYYSLFGDILEYHSWTCLGDPEMTVRTGTTRHIVVMHDTVLWASPDSTIMAIDVQFNTAPVESALVCILSKKDSTVYQYKRTDGSGHVQFIDTFKIPGDSVLITVTGRNLMPYYRLIRVNLSGRPHVLLNAFALWDSAGGNNDSIANPGEDIEIPTQIKNWGDSTAYNVIGVIRESQTDPFISLYDTVKYFGDISGLDTGATSNDGYNAVIAPDCPDSHRVILDLAISDQNDSLWISEFCFFVHAPILGFLDYHFPGSLKYTAVADTNQLFVEIGNTGSYPAENAVGRIWSDDSFFIPLDSIATFGTIASGASGSNQSDPFIITTSVLTPPGYPLDLCMEITASAYVDTMHFTIYAGQKDYFVFDKSPSNMSGLTIDALLDSLEFSGDYADTLPTHDYLSLYKAVFICLGTFPDNFIITDSSQTGQNIERYISVLDGKLYLEGGDVWYADPHYYHGYQFHPLFSISPISNSIGPLSSVEGEDSTFTNSMTFVYSGGSNSLDRIEPDSPGFCIFEKPENSFGCGIAADHRTVGLTFEIGGLQDGSAPSTKLALVDSIMDYFGIPPTGIRVFKNWPAAPIFGLSVYPNPSHKIVNMFIQNTGNDQNAVLHIYDITGRLVKSFELSTTDSQPIVLSWNGTDMHNRQVGQGVYFLCLYTRTKTINSKIIYLK